MDDDKSLDPQLRKWLTNQGYPLEMKFAERARKLTKFSVRQGWHFEDPEAGTSREIDVVCTASEPHGFAEINFVIECKGTSKPWVIFSSEDAIAGYHRLAAFGLFSKDAFSEIAKRAFDFENHHEAARSTPWLWKTGRVGYAIAQAFSEGNDAPYAGSLSALKAAIWLQKNSLWQSAEQRKFVATFPTVVTSSPLFECYLDHIGDIKIEPIDMGFLFFPRKIGGFGRTCLSIVSSNGIDKFIQECDQVAAALMSMLQPSIKHECDQFRGPQETTTLRRQP